MLLLHEYVSCNSCDLCDGTTYVTSGFKIKGTKKFREKWGEALESKMPWGIAPLAGGSGQGVMDDDDSDDDAVPGPLPPAAGAGKRPAAAVQPANKRPTGGGKMASALWRREFGESCDSTLFHF